MNKRLILWMGAGALAIAAGAGAQLILGGGSIAPSATVQSGTMTLTGSLGGVAPGSASQGSMSLIAGNTASMIPDENSTSVGDWKTLE